MTADLCCVATEENAVLKLLPLLGLLLAPTTQHAPLTCPDVYTARRYCCPMWCSAKNKNRPAADAAFNACADAHGCGGRYHGQAFQICSCR